MACVLYGVVYMVWSIWCGLYGVAFIFAKPQIPGTGMDGTGMDGTGMDDNSVQDILNC